MSLAISILSSSFISVAVFQEQWSLTGSVLSGGIYEQRNAAVPFADSAKLKSWGVKSKNESIRVAFPGLAAAPKRCRAARLASLTLLELSKITMISEALRSSSR